MHTKASLSLEYVALDITGLTTPEIVTVDGHLVACQGSTEADYSFPPHQSRRLRRTQCVLDTKYIKTRTISNLNRCPPATVNHFSLEGVARE